MRWHVGRCQSWLCSQETVTDMTFSGKVRVTVVIGYTVTTGIKGERVASVWPVPKDKRQEENKHTNVSSGLIRPTRQDRRHGN